MTDAAPRIEAGDLAEAPIATPDSYDRIGHAMLNSGLPALKVQYDVLNEERSLIGCFGSWRSGKTRGGAMRVARAGCANPWRPIYGRTNPYSFIFSETVNVLTDSTLPEMLSVLPKEAILRVWEGRGHQRIRLINGHDYVFRTWMGANEGGSACAVWVDEAHKLSGPHGPEHTWRNYVMRATDTRSQHKVVIATGLPEFGHLSDLFNSEDTSERVTYLCSLLDNFYLVQKDMDRLRASCTAEEAETLIKGNWRKPQNVIYYAFDEYPAPRGNFVPTQGDRARPVDIAMDLGDLGAILVSQRVSVWGVNSQGRRARMPGVLVVDEYLPTAMGAEEALRAFLRDKSWFLDSTSKIYVDPKSSRDQLAAIAKVMGTDRPGGPELVRQKPHGGNEAYGREYGYRCANVGFRDANGNRRLFIWSGMPREKRSLLTALRRHKRKDNGIPYRDNTVDHISDCLRYLVADQLPVETGGGMVVHKRAA